MGGVFLSTFRKSKGLVCFKKEKNDPEQSLQLPNIFQLIDK